MNKEALQRAVEIAGGQRPLASAIEVSPARVWNWLNGTPVPPEFLRPICEVTGVLPSEIRPDLAEIFSAQVRGDSATAA